LFGGLLQRFERGKWKFTRVKIHGISLGFEDGNLVQYLKIDPGMDAPLLFDFSTGLFGIRKGDRLRIAFNVWPDTDSAESFKPGTRVFSAEFASPTD